MRGEGCGEIEGDLCIGVGDMADYLVETGKGRYIDYDEVMEILERAEENGFVHQITNIDGEEKIFAICNCAPGVCNASEDLPAFQYSEYVAFGLPRTCGSVKMRGLRTVRGSLSGGGGKTGTEALHKAWGDPVSESAVFRTRKNGAGTNGIPDYRDHAKPDQLL